MTSTITAQALPSRGRRLHVSTITNQSVMPLAHMEPGDWFEVRTPPLYLQDSGKPRHSPEAEVNEWVAFHRSPFKFAFKRTSPFSVFVTRTA